MSLKKAKRDLEAAEKAGRWEDVSTHCSEVGKLLSDQGKFREALDYHRREREVCSEHGDDHGEALAERAIGENLLSLFEFEESLVHSKKYLAIARRLQDAAEEQRALYVLGQAHLDMAINQEEAAGSLNNSLEYFQRSLNAVKAIPSGEVGIGERIIMKARCLRNMASINWQLRRRDKFEELFDKAKRELGQLDTREKFEDLFGLYDEAANLMLVGDDLQTAKIYTDLAESSAKKVKGKKERICWFRSQVTKSKVLILQEDFEEAFATLLSAYKQKVSSELDAAVENNVKMLAVIVKAREKMPTDSTRAFRYLEKIADALCDYSEAPEKKKVLELAIKYYKLASERAKSEGEVEVLAALNNSLAQTYMDCGDYSNSETFFIKQLDYEKFDDKAACQTYSNIASVQESLGKGFESVQAVMKKWLDLAKSLTEDSDKEEKIALQEMLKLHDRFGRNSESGQYKERLEELATDSEELPSSQGSSAPVDNFPEIDIDDLKLSDAKCSTSRPSRYNSSLAGKLNGHGDTPLHKAAQEERKAGELVSLLKRGAPTEVTDNAGWTPLGDAVGEGNLEAVKILLQYGANINHANDNCGHREADKASRGMTPFMEACNSSHLEIAEYLLSQGAKVHLKSQNGTTALAILRRLFSKEKDPSTLERIERLIEKVVETYRQLGLDVDVAVAEGGEEDSPSLIDDSMPSPEKPKFSRSPIRRRRLSRSVSPLSSPKQTIRLTPPSSPLDSASPPQSQRSPSSSLPSPGRGRQQYREAMAGLKSFSRRGSDQPLSSTQKRPLVNKTNAVADDLSDWLEDDLADIPVKRKRPSLEQVATSSRKSDENRPPPKTTIPSTAGAHQRRQPALSMESIHAPSSEAAAPEENTMSKLKKKNAGFQPKINRIYARAPSPVIDLTAAPSTSTSSPTKPTTTSTEATTAATLRTINKIRVKVQDQVLLVPLASLHMTIGSLAQEAARRYCRVKGGAEPVLLLSTSDGALLDAGDFVSDVVDDKDPVLKGKVESWITKSADERYADFCSARGLTNFKNLHTKLSAIESTFEFRLQSSPLRNQQADAVLASLTSCPTLRSLTLNGCKLADSLLPQLTRCLSSLPSLNSLDLSMNMLSMDALNNLASLSIPSLRSLDFSRNMLGDRPVPDLTKAFPGLTKLSLQSCYLANPSIPGVQKLEYLDISCNEMKLTDLLKFITNLSKSDSLKIRGLTLSCDESTRLQLASAWKRAFGERAESLSESNDQITLSLS